MDKTKLLILFCSAGLVLYALVGGLLDGVSASNDVYRGLRIFTDVMDKLSQEYVEEPDLTKAVRGGLHEMMEALDPYSSFISSDVYREMVQKEDESAPSPGLVIAKRYGYGYVVSVVESSPADQRGLRTGDLVESVDGRMTNEMSLWEVRKRLAGGEGTTVRLRVIRFRRVAPVEMDLRREKLELPEVSARIVEDGIGYLSISHFSGGVAQAVSSKLKMLQSSSLRALIVDVRGTAVGSLEEAVRVSDYFLPPAKKILTAAGREGQKRDFFSLTEPIVSDIPIVLLIDGGSSGAAEAFAAALTDHGVAETVGEKTDGKGSLHDLLHLEDGSVLEIATERLYRPSGDAIQTAKAKTSGVTPEVRSPGPEFVSNFYFQNTTEELQADLGEEFYKKLNRAIKEAQFEEAIRVARRRVLRDAA